MSLLLASGLSKTHHMADHQVHALRGVTLSVQAGELVAVVGPSGSGKSTLLSLLGGLERATAGTVRFLGKDYGQLSEDALTRLRRRSIGYVFQSFNLIPGLTAAENVSLTAFLDGRRPSTREVAVVLETVGLGNRANHRAVHLSGGEQQRVAIARALLTKPELILADEPTASLDSGTGAGILSLLREAVSGGQSVVMVTHDMHAAAHAHRVIYLRDGLVVGEEGGWRR